MFICMYVCKIYLCMYVYIIYVCMYNCIYVFIFMCVYVYTYVYRQLTCRVAWRTSNGPCWPLQHLKWYRCAVRPKSRVATVASWFSLRAVSFAAAAIWSLRLAFLSIYCTFIVFLYLYVRARVCVCVCVCVCVRACVCVCVSILSFLLSSFQYILPSYHLTSFLLHHSLTHPPNLTYLFYVLFFLFSDTLTIPFINEEGICECLPCSKCLAIWNCNLFLLILLNLTTL